MFFPGSPGIAQLRHREPVIAQAIVALQKRAYRREAELLNFADLPPLKETPADVMGSGETFWGLTASSRLVALIATEPASGGLQISRLCVAPESARRGYGTRLVRHVLNNAEGSAVFVTTGEDNGPAQALYEKLGFVTHERWESPEGLKLVTLRRDPDGTPIPATDGGAG